MDVQEKGSESTRTSLELLYHVSRELATALDLRTVLQRVLSLSVKTVGAISGSIIVLDESGAPIDGAIIIGERILENTASQLRITYERGLAGWAARHGQVVLVPDTSQDERWLRRPDDAEDRTGSKSAVSSPIRARESLVGVITLVHPRPGFFNLEHLALVQSIADQAGIAILNARFYAESQRQARVMTALAESAAVITASLNLDEVLQHILEQASQALRVEVASLALLDGRGQELEFRASTDRVEHSIIGRRVAIGQGVAGWVAKEGRGIIVPNAYQDTRFYREVDRSLNFRTRGIACAPIRSRNQVIGIIEAINPVEGVFDPDALLVLTGIGSLAGTAIRHAQLFESLEAAHLRYHELFEDSIDSILITDWHGNILDANRQAAALFGRDSEVLRQLRIGELHTLDIDKLGEGFTLLTNGETVSYESSVHGTESHSTPIQVYARQVQIEDAMFVQWILRDISERKNLDELRNDLIAMIYHDLRAPLANVVSSLDVLASVMPVGGDPAFRSLFNISLRSVERIQRLTNSLLDINRLEAGQPVWNRQPTTIPAMVADAVDAVEPLAQNKKLSIDTSMSKDLPLVYVDGDMMRRVLINLLENAIKFTPASGKILVGAQRLTDEVHMWVQDNGPGIPAGEMERIFDKFARLHVKDGPRGLGLGLAYCRLAVLGHGGRIWVESSPGEGSRFIFALPITNEDSL